VMCLGMNPNGSLRSSAWLLTTRRILVSRIFSSSLPVMFSRIFLDKTRVVSNPTRVSGWKTHGLVSKLTGSTVFKISH